MADFSSWKYENLVDYAKETTAMIQDLQAINSQLRSDLRFALGEIRRRMQQEGTDQGQT